MRVLVVDSYFYPHTGGSQKYAEELYISLRKLDPQIKVDVIAYNTKRTHKVEKYRGLTIYRVSCIEILPDQFALPNYFSLLKLIRKLTHFYHYDIVNSQNRFFDHSWWVPFLAKKIGAKSILTDHCASHPQHRNILVSLIAKIFDLTLVPFFMRIYDSVIATNKSTKKFLNKLGIPDVKIVSGGVDTKYFKPQQSMIKRIIPKARQVFTPKDIIISFVGRMIKSKGTDLFIELASQLSETSNNLYFILAGSGPEYKKLSQKASKNIIFTGNLTSKEVALLLSNTDILVHPSLHHEGFPNVLLEASASGCAIIATNQGGSKEIIINSKTGLLTNPSIEELSQKVSKLAKSKKLRIQLGRNARDHVEKNFQWPTLAQKYLAITNL